MWPNISGLPGSLALLRLAYYKSGSCTLYTKAGDGVSGAEQSTLGTGGGTYGAEQPTVGQEVLYLTPSSLL